MLNELKQLVVNTRLGLRALHARERAGLLYAACFGISDLGTMANDYLATFLISRICAPGMTFIDVGAHIGSVVASVQRHVPSAAIIAVEAIPEKASHLHRKFPNVEVHQVVLGDSEGEVNFYVDNAKSGYSSLFRPAEFASANIDKITVHMTRLDSLTLNTVDAIKVDVEGAELDVLRGSTATISRNRPIIMYESGPASNVGLETIKTLQWDFFNAHNYRVLVPNRLAHNDDGMTSEGYIESHLYPRRTTNYFAVPTERALEFRDRARQILSVTPL